MLTGLRTGSITRPVSFATSNTLEGDTYHLRLTGDFDLAAVAPAQAAVDAAFRCTWHVLALDCSALDFLDSSGLHFITDLDELCRAQERRLTIKPGPRPVHRVFELTGMDAVLPFETDPPAASPTQES